MKVEASPNSIVEDVPKPAKYEHLMSKVQDDGAQINIFDLETKRAPDEVGGWGNIDDMGVSILCEYDSQNGWNHYEEEQLDEFVGKMMKSDLVIGFNHEHFDYEVLSGLGYSESCLSEINSLDIMKYIEDEIGNRVKLEDLATQNLSVEKLENGKYAPEMWKNGEYMRVTKYCYSDVILTKSLFIFGMLYGFLLLPDYHAEKGCPNVQVDW